MLALTYILADDEALYRELAQQYLSASPNLTCLKICENAIEVNYCLQEIQPDFLLLDIDMPGLSGLSLVKSLAKKPYVIFISSHSNFAAEAFEVDAIDFIKKPISQDRLLRAVEKVRHLVKVKELLQGETGFKNSDDNSFFIREDSAFVRIRYQEVLYIESLIDFVKIHFEDGSEKLVLVNLKNLEQQLPDNSFMRISRSLMVHVQKVSALHNGSIMLGNIQLPIGASYANKVIQTIVGNKVIKRYV